MERHDISPGGAAWVRASLERGRALSAAVLEAVDLAAGGAVAVVPAGTSPERTAALATGGLAVVHDAADELDAVLSEGVGGRPCTLLVEDAHALASDAWVTARHRPGVATVGDVVVQWLALPARPGEAGAFVRRKGGGYPTNAFVVAATPAELGLDPPGPLDALPAAVAAAVEAVVVAAYDAESFVVWRPAPSRR